MLIRFTDGIKRIAATANAEICGTSSVMSALFKIQIARYPKIPQMLSVSNSRRGMLLSTAYSVVSFAFS